MCYPTHLTLHHSSRDVGGTHKEEERKKKAAYTLELTPFPPTFCDEVHHPSSEAPPLLSLSPYPSIYPLKFTSTT